MKRLSSSSLRQPNVLVSNIWLKQALQSLAGNEPGGVLGSIFAGYVPLATQNPYPIIVYSVATEL